MSALFVTGTDTGCGKTEVATALIRALQQRGLRVAAFKPVAAGAQWSDGELQNDDALALLRAANVAQTYRETNPYCFAEPVSPHLAASSAATLIDPDTISAGLAALMSRSDLVVVEGAGGWRVPLGPKLDIERLVLHLGVPVLLVVGLRLGCLNHALLSEQAILASGATLLGWLASEVDPAMARVDENLDTLRTRMQTRCLGVHRHTGASDPVRPPVPFDLDALLGASSLQTGPAAEGARMSETGGEIIDPEY